MTQPIHTIEKVEEGFALFRNGKPMPTPAGHDLIVPTQPLAEAIVREWRAQKDKINPSSMPMTQLAATAIDITKRNRTTIVTQLADYAQADLLCFFAEGPDELMQRQRKNWQPVLDWCAKRFDALLMTGQGIMPVKQSPQALEALRCAVESFDDFTLTGVKHAAEVAGSLTLALALVEKHIGAQQVFEAAELDARFQTERWGEDPATAKRHESIRDDLVLCEKWFSLLK